MRTTIGKLTGPLRRTVAHLARGQGMSLISRELREVWDALRAAKGQRDEDLAEVRIRNLRGIWDLRFPFPYPVTVLAGPNGSGKSTVLFACACAYRVPGRGPGDFAPSRLFPNFVSRQDAVRSDPVPGTQLEFHYLHRGDRLSMTWRRGKSWSRKGDSQPERQVYLRTLANLTNPAEVRSILQLGRKQFQTETIGPDLLIFAHRILPWRYHNVNLFSGQSSRNLLFAEIEGAGDTRYSEFHMSSGERTIVRISKDISGLKNALVLIDEVDTGLHPYTQQQAMLELQRSALRQKLQIVVASHSPVVLDSVPPEARIFLDRDHGTGQVRREPLYRDIFQKALYGQSTGSSLGTMRRTTWPKGVIRGVLDVLNVEMGLRPEDVEVGRNTGRDEFSRPTFRTLGKFGKLSDFILVLDGDSRDMENSLKAVAEGYGHAFATFVFFREMHRRSIGCGASYARGQDGLCGYVWSCSGRFHDDDGQGGESGRRRCPSSAMPPRAALGALADDLGRTVPDIARSVGRREAENGAMPELLHALREQNRSLAKITDVAASATNRHVSDRPVRMAATVSAAAGGDPYRRPLLGLELSCRLIAEAEDSRIRRALATNLSDLFALPEHAVPLRHDGAEGVGHLLRARLFRSDWCSASRTSRASSTVRERMSARGAGRTSWTSM